MKEELAFDVAGLQVLPSASADGEMKRGGRRKGGGGDHNGSGNSGSLSCLITLSNLLNGSDLNVLNIFGGGLGL